ncbi:adhesion G-protein coupled receptor G2 isoform X2 [Xenopus laevis]|uniref:Adhesion G-protein coupled receptor G2 n=1 Tax=Xenopus laevis TaxID=8355 RepID=A0A8J1MCZ6_XENLA|nr:adhesion G-protein coupled receptor G2 isoform X2 [Xenopus laevis]
MPLAIHRMVVCDSWHMRNTKAKLSPAKLKTVQLLCFSLFILAIPQLAYTDVARNFEVVFKEPCKDTITTELDATLPEFTLCTYIKLNSSGPWTAFTYNVTSSPADGYEFGLLGDSGSINIWMFGSYISIPETLNLSTWYEACITWDNKTNLMEFMLDHTMKKYQKLENGTKLSGKGTISLGCPLPPEKNNSTSMGLIGELYMFRIWNKASNFTSCYDGDILPWKSNWIGNQLVFRKDVSLPCAIKLLDLPSGHHPTKRPQMVNDTSPEQKLLAQANVSDPATSALTSTITNTGTTTTTTTKIPQTPATKSEMTFTVTGNHTSTLITIVSNMTLAGNGSTLSVAATTSMATPGVLHCAANVSNATNYSVNQQYCDASSLCNDSAVYFVFFNNTSKDECDTIKDKLQALIFPRSSSAPPTPSPLIKLNSSASQNTSATESTSKSSLGNSTVPPTQSSTNQVNISATEFTSNSAKECNIILIAPDKERLCSALSTMPNTTENITVLVADVCCCEPNVCPANISDYVTRCNSSKIVNCAATGPGQGTGAGTEPRPWPVTSISTAKTTATSSSPLDLGYLNDALASPDLNSSMVDAIVSQIEQMLIGELQPGTAMQLVGVMNSFLNLSMDLLAPVSRRLIGIVDKITLQLTFPGQSINITSPALALAVDKINASLFNGAAFGVKVSSDLQVSLGSNALQQNENSVVLPGSLLKVLSPTDQNVASRVQFNFFDKTSLFVDSSLPAKKQLLVSTVISASVSNLTLNDLQDNVTVHLQTTSKTRVNVSMLCVFWNFNANNGRGGWDSNGCSVVNTTVNQTICTCNHLTSFAILMDVSKVYLSPEDTLILTFITYIGCGLSAIFLSVTLVTYIAFEKIRRDYPSKILIQLCAALIFLNLTFLINPWIALYNNIPGLCISAAAFLHYFLLVSITWMGLEAFHMYLSLVKVFNTYVRKYMLKFCIVGWGVPAVVVAIILAVNKDLYSLQTRGKYPNGASDDICWIADIIFYITVVGYYCVIFLLTVGMFIVVILQLCRIKKQKQLGFQKKITLQDMRSVAGITFLLGITWGLAFFSWGPGSVVIIYLFTIFNTLQGFFIFIFYCVAKENVRKQWKRYLCCGKFRLAENSDWSKATTSKLKKQVSKQGVSSSSSSSIQSSGNSNSTTLLVSNEYSPNPTGNGVAFKERNGVSFNKEVPLYEIPMETPTKATNSNEKPQPSVRRTSKMGNVHFMD